MKKVISIFLFLIMLQSCTGSKKTLPILMLDQDVVMSRVVIEPNPFEIISSEFITELILDAVKHTQCIIIFIEDYLTTEDITSRDKLGTPFYNLQKGLTDNKVIYMPAVIEPYELFRQIFEPDTTNMFYLGSGDKLKILDQHKYVYVYFQDDSEINRIEQLRKHDMLMKEVYFTVRQLKAGPVVAFYTGKRNPIPVSLLTFNPYFPRKAVEERGVMVVTRDALFRLTGEFSSTKTRRSLSIEDAPVVIFEMRSREVLTTTMLITDFHLQFTFEVDDIANWKLANVALLEAGEEVGRAETDIEAPWHRSYYCSEPITIINKRDGSSITISEYQIEPLPQRRNEGENEGEKEEDSTTDSSNELLNTTENPGHCSFSKSINCGPYYNATILAGLMVVAIFTIITFWGVTILMDCGRNDRYDDPNQKPLVIAQETSLH